MHPPLRPPLPRRGVAMVRRVTVTMDGGESTLAFWRVGDVGEALDVARDMGLPLTSRPNVADGIIFLVCHALADLDIANPR